MIDDERLYDKLTIHYIKGNVNVSPLIIAQTSPNDGSSDDRLKHLV